MSKNSSPTSSPDTGDNLVDVVGLESTVAGLSDDTTGIQATGHAASFFFDCCIF